MRLAWHCLVMSDSRTFRTDLTVRILSYLNSVVSLKI